MPTSKNPTKAKVEISNLKKPKESKEAIFIRLATPRVQNILKALRILGNCSNRSNYSYNQDQVNKMFSTITNALMECEKKFSKSKIEQESFEF